MSTIAFFQKAVVGEQAVVRKPIINFTDAFKVIFTEHVSVDKSSIWVEHAFLVYLARSARLSLKGK